MEFIRLNNGEKVVGAGLTVFDQKGKAIAELAEGDTVVYTASEDPSTIAQFVPDAPNSLTGTITTEGDDVGKVTFTGTVTLADKTVLNDADGNIPQIEVTVINSKASTASFTPGTVEPE